MTNANKKTLNVAALARTINDFEAGKLTGRGAERRAAYAVKALEDNGISPAEACRKYA